MKHPAKQPKKKGGKATVEVQQSKSPAEFFAENQSIAGFGKSVIDRLCLDRAML